MKKINSRKALNFTIFFVLLVLINSCTKPGLTPPPGPVDPPPQVKEKPMIKWATSVDTTHRSLPDGIQVYRAESLTLSITATYANSSKIVESGSNSATTGELTGDATYNATATGDGGTTTSSFGLKLMSWNKTYLCQNGPKWQMVTSKLAVTLDSLAEPLTSEWGDGILEQNTQYRYYPDGTGDVITLTGPNAGIHSLNGGYQLLNNDTHILFYGDDPRKIESINASVMVISQVKRVFNSNTLWSHFKWTYNKMP